VGFKWALFGNRPAGASNFFLLLVGLTALRENDQERVTVYTKHRLTLQALVTEALGLLVGFIRALFGNRAAGK